MNYKISRRKFLLSIPFIINSSLKKNILVEIIENNKKIYYHYEDMALEEVPLKIIPNHPNSSRIIVIFYNEKKYLYTKIFWKVPLLEDFNLWNRQKWKKDMNIWDEENIDLIISGF